MRFVVRLVPVLILLLAAAARLHNLDAQSLWHDEGISLRLAERSLPDLVDATSRDIHPPGYYLTLKSWIAFAGTTEFGLRSLSAFWGILAAAATFALGRRLFDLPAATVAAILVAANPFAVYYGQETRMYAQLGAFSMLGLWLLVTMLAEAERKPDYRRLFPRAGSLAVVNVLGLYTHYTYPFTLAVQSIYFGWWWIKHRDSTTGLTYVGLNVVTLVLFAPWLPTAYDQITTWPTTGDSTSTIDRLDRIVTILVYGHTTGDLSMLAYGVPAILLLAALLTTRSFPTIPLLLCAFSVGSLLLSGAYREANLKFLHPAQNAMALLLACGATRIASLPQIKQRTVTWTICGIAVALAGLIAIRAIQGLAPLYNDATFARSDYRGIVRDISAEPRPNDAIILDAPNQQEVFSYYYKGSTPVFPLPKGLGGDDLSTQATTQAIIAQYRRIFLVLWGQHERDPNAIVQSTLDTEAFVVRRQWYNDVELVQYAVLASPPATPDEWTDVRFGEHITLQGVALSGTWFEAGQGDVLGVTLFWETDAPLEKRYKVSIQVLDSAGRLASQHDSEPANGRAPTNDWQPSQPIVDNHGLILSRDLPPGEYEVIIVVYNADESAERLQPAGGNPNDAYSLAALTLE